MPHDPPHTDPTERRLEQAAALAQAGDVDAALDAYGRVVAEQPGCLAAHYALGNLRHERGEYAAATRCYQQALAIAPRSPLVLNNLGHALQQLGRLDEAATAYRQALALNPAMPRVRLNLATVLETRGELDAAEAELRKALHAAPDSAQAHAALGRILDVRDNPGEALSAYQRAHALAPDDAGILCALAAVLRRLGRLPAAGQAYARALRIAPGLALAHHELGTTLQLQGRLEAAMGCYRRAIEQDPGYVSAYANLGNALQQLGRMGEAIEAYDGALAVVPDFAPARLGVCVAQLPLIYSSTQELEDARARYARQLRALDRHYREADAQQMRHGADAVASLQPFYLAYQGRDDRDLQQIHGEMSQRLMSRRYPRWSEPPRPAPGRQRVRVGVVSGFFADHSNWKIPIRGWVENLDPARVELFGYHTRVSRGADTDAARPSFARFVQGPMPFEDWCRVIAADRPDALLFPELGMDPTTFRLACLRLAPVQMSSWGHPQTSGLPGIGHFLSSDGMEPPDGERHYSETLVRLPRLSIHYTPPARAGAATASVPLKLADGELMLWCCQSLFKYLPRHDRLFARIASELGRCRLVFIEHVTGAVTAVFRNRLRHAFDALGLDYGRYCTFVPGMSPARFEALTARADLFLDSIGWSGCNSSLEAIAQAIPMVTLPGGLMRSRHTAAMLDLMGLSELVARDEDDYVAIAVRLGRDADYRRHVSRHIARERGVLYRDLAPVRALEDLLEGLRKEGA